ncbi:hypothetical protein MEM_06232 [Candida albicans L26]|uniref:Uncharacterized protein n=2 Tax=Candida albicans TaxID=5476 RepID=C4YMS6_CANAW|nr:conserved hypothetical protein [Candida albicans WO-1]KGQ80633.1 hypothetical protein MG1_06252 [Candida albicans GC75]KGQ80820.1 hypothetical protein MEU_06214 [Candida albicans P37005]KGR00580.1 hypothetical protein MG3_06250 [Candida albicans P78048]KGR05233.1 hypothetical protein MG9_06237 [Candida albicans P37037]KGT62809.1 hypothetical protein MEK_06215 [Candida albicans 12C]KGU00319.1 hypothetical protein MEM_06232 [Candida albicans L26]KGU00506.1 hypothetical protein MEQ_06193 [Ca
MCLIKLCHIKVYLRNKVAGYNIIDKKNYNLTSIWGKNSKTLPINFLPHIFCQFKFYDNQKLKSLLQNSVLPPFVSLNFAKKHTKKFSVFQSLVNSLSITIRKLLKLC